MAEFKRIQAQISRFTNFKRKHPTDYDIDEYLSDIFAGINHLENSGIDATSLRAKVETVLSFS